MTLYLQILLSMALAVGALWLVLRWIGAALACLARVLDRMT